MTATTIHPADAALLGWLGHADQCDSAPGASLDGFLRHGAALFGAGHVVGESNRRLAEIWRNLANRGVSLIGPSFDPTNTMKVWGTRQGARRRDLGCRLHGGEAPSPAVAPRTGSSAWSRWRREASAWAWDEDKRRAAAQTAFAAERLRLQLELVWMGPASPVDQLPAAGRQGSIRPVGGAGSDSVPSSHACESARPREGTRPGRRRPQ
jgi:hypothetical protein